MRVNGLTSQDLAALGIVDTTEVVYNPDYDTLFQEETRPDLEGFARGTPSDAATTTVTTTSSPPAACTSAGPISTSN